MLRKLLIGTGLLTLRVVLTALTPLVALLVVLGGMVGVLGVWGGALVVLDGTAGLRGAVAMLTGLAVLACCAMIRDGWGRLKLETARGPSAR